MATKDLVDALRKAFECVCGGGRCSKLSLEYGARDGGFMIVVDEDSLRTGIFGVKIRGYGSGILMKYDDYYEFTGSERDEWGTGFNTHRLSDDDIKFLVEGVEALALCSPDLSFLIDRGRDILDVFSEFVFAVGRGFSDGFSYKRGSCSLRVGVDGGGAFGVLSCEWMNDVLYVEAWEMRKVVSFRRINVSSAVAWVTYDKNDNDVSIAVNTSFVSDVAAFYRELREKLESRLDEVEGVLRGPAKKVYLGLFFP